MDISKVRRSIEEAHISAFNLSVNAAYPLPENIESLLQTAYKEAYWLALNAGIPSPDTIKDLIRKAHAEMLSLSARLATVNEKDSK